MEDSSKTPISKVQTSEDEAMEPQNV